MSKEKNYEQIAVELPPGLRKQAKLAAAECGTTVSAVVREALIRFVQRVRGRS